MVYRNKAPKLAVLSLGLAGLAASLTPSIGNAAQTSTSIANYNSSAPYGTELKIGEDGNRYILRYETEEPNEGEKQQDKSSYGWLIVGLAGTGLALLAGYGALRLRSKMT